MLAWVLHYVKSIDSIVSYLFIAVYDANAYMNNNEYEIIKIPDK